MTLTEEIVRLTELEDRHWWYQERRTCLRRQLRELPAPRPGDRALDIGAAGGGNTRILMEHGWSALVADFSEVAVEVARERGVDAVHADARDLPMEAGTFGLVTMFDTLEHIQEDDQVLREIARVLRPGGTLLISTPCDMGLWSSHDEYVGHVRRYDRDGLTQVVEQAGLVIDRLWSWNVLLRPVVKLRRRKLTGSDLDELHPLLNNTLRMIVASERYIPLGALPGVSLRLRAHRPREISSRRER